jgi:hypothetical protein
MLHNTPLHLTVPKLMRSCAIQGVYCVFDLPSGPGATFFVGCCEAKEWNGTEQVLADEIHTMILVALGFYSHLVADDDCLRVEKSANMSTDCFCDKMHSPFPQQ